MIGSCGMGAVEREGACVRMVECWHLDFLSCERCVGGSLVGVALVVAESILAYACVCLSKRVGGRIFADGFKSDCTSIWTCLVAQSFAQHLAFLSLN